MKIKLSKVLVLTFAGLATIPLLLAALLISYYTYTFQKEQVFHHETIISQNMAANLETFFQRLQYQLEMVSRFQDFNNLEPSVQEGVFAELLATEAIFRDLSLLDSGGNIQIFVSSSGLFSSEIPASCLDSITAGWQTVMRTGVLQYGAVRFDTVTGEPLIHVALPVISLKSGEIGGVIGADTRLKTIWESQAKI